MKEQWPTVAAVRGGAYSHMEKHDYKDDVLRRMQQTEMEMLREFDRICRSNSIAYILEGGTLLGAFRHGGFIPWDDDIDIKMLRGDYERFCEVCKTQLDDKKFFLQTYRTDPGYRWGYARILRNGTTFMRKGQDRLTMRRGIFIDIFPVDGMPDRFVAKALFNFCAFLFRKILYSKVGVSNTKNPFIRILYFCASLVPKRFGFMGLEWLSSLYAGKHTELVRCLSWGSAEQSAGFRREWFIHTQDMMFEDLLVMAPKDTPAFLTFAFGEDFMTPPPPEKRLPRHTATFIRFNEEE